MVAPLWRHTQHELTGRVRHRRNWRGKMILQVEVSYKLVRGISEQGKTMHYWRDAIYTDFDGAMIAPQQLYQPEFS